MPGLTANLLRTSIPITRLRMVCLCVMASVACAGLFFSFSGASFAKEQDIPDPASNVVELKFAWPVGLAGTATTDSLRIQRRGDKAVTFEVTDETSFTLESADRGLLLRFSGIRMNTRITPESPGQQGELQKLFQVLSAMQPSYIVSPQGKLVDVAGLDKFRESILAQLDKYGSSLLKTARPRVKALVMKQFSRDELLALISADWNRLVGHWVGAALRLGATYQVNSSSPRIPLLGNITLPGQYVFGATRRVPCGDTGTAVKCVELHMTSQLDPGKTAAALRKYTREAAKQTGAGVDRIKSVRMKFDLILVTEPSTLIPHDTTSVTRTVVTTIDSDGRRSTSYDTRSVTVHYHYK
ncbi:MAG: hypothetical protein WB783_17660 [Arenicellales bacterium]